MADGVTLSDADLERLGPDARAQVRKALDQEDQAGTSSTDSSSSSSSGSSGSSGARARGRARRRVRVPAAARRPARTLVRRGSTLFVGAIALTIAYWALNHPDAIALMLRAPGRALRWLADPTSSIPYATPEG